MAASSHANAFIREKEKQQEIYDVTISIINNILRNVMPAIQRVGLTSTQALPILESLSMNHGIIESLKTTLTRRKMKVPIFGPTSSGKSMVINAMLGKELLASSMGHTTNCFLMIEQTALDDSGDDVVQTYHDASSLPRESQSHFIIRRSSVAQNTRSDGKAKALPRPYEEDVKYCLDTKVLQGLSDAAEEDKSLDVSFHIEVFLGKKYHRCPLLSHFLQIVDCPGVSTCRELGDHVKAFCGDADVHVLIVNTASGISHEEKEHFLKVKERLPNPDIIIGFTQWDLTANEQPQRKEKVKQQHLKAAFELLKSTGTVSSMEQVKERCFFISGKEALDDALCEQVKYAEGQQERKQAFHDFMRKIEERASVEGKKAKLDINRRACLHVLISCVYNIDTLREWIRQTINELVIESQTIKEAQILLATRILEYNVESRKLREKVLTAVEEELMENLDFVITKMRNILSKTTKKMKAFNSDFHEHGVTIVHDWYANIIRISQRSTRTVCEDYSRDLLLEYKTCFKDFPHEYPKAFIEALHEEILPQVNSNTELSNKKVDSLLHGVTDRGLIAMFATTRRRVNDIDAQNSQGRAESQRMAAGASILFLRVRRWLMAEVDSQLLEKFEVERKRGLNDIKQSCRNAVEVFCDITDAYYNNQIDNALRLQYKRELEERQNRIREISQLGQRLNNYRREAEEVKQKCGLDEHPEGYAREIFKR